MTESQRKNAESQRKMTDREYVIRRLAEVSEYTRAKADIAGVGKGKEIFDSWYRAVEDAIALLQEQKPDETRLVHHYSRPGVYADLWLYCEKCGGKIDDGRPHRPKFCPECGREVKWE